MNHFDLAEFRSARERRHSKRHFARNRGRRKRRACGLRPYGNAPLRLSARRSSFLRICRPTQPAPPRLNSQRAWRRLGRPNDRRLRPSCRRQPHPQAAQPAVAAQEDCLASLAAKGAMFEPAKLEPPADPRCVVAAAGHGRVAGLGRRPAHRPAGSARRSTASPRRLSRALSRRLWRPLVKGSFDASVAAIRTGPGFDCRTRDHVAGGKISEHARGLAIDIASISFAGGRIYQVGALTDDAERAFDHAARAAACGYFHTALGPGADAFHASHWHVDLESRGADGKSKFCQ